MKKEEAITQMVSGFSAIPQEWVRIIAEEKHEYFNLPMWGTLWIMDYFGEELYNNARVMVGEADEIDLDAIGDEDERKQVKEAIDALKQESISWGECILLENYVDEEMAGERCVLDKDGNTTAMFIYELDGQYLLGVNGAGWNFYNGVWDKLYDICGLQWHESEEGKQPTH